MELKLHAAARQNTFAGQAEAKIKYIDFFLCAHMGPKPTAAGGVEVRENVVYD